MIIILLLSCVTIAVSAVPVGTSLPQLSQGGATQRVQPTGAINQKLEAQTAAPLSPDLEPGIPQQPEPKAMPQLSHSLPLYTWFPQGGSPLTVPMQGFAPLPQQPLIFTPYGFLPLLSSPYNNQMVSPYGFPRTHEPPLPQTLTYQPPSSPALPAENAAAAAAPSEAGLQQTQQQNPQVVYLLQQHMNSALGGLSSEELEMANKISQLSVYMQSVLTNVPAGAGSVPPESRAAALANQEQQGVKAASGSSAAGVAPSQGLPCSGSQATANNVPAGLEKAAPESPGVQTPGQPKASSTHKNRV
ncbi:uncharacterized protein LOC133450940 [Cololabis saira]|uniref:uncharacterized protein LOC133450940 n=1 Tax=Cololabis saira TaxID=129043 RepID=UPI002AD2DDCD|nr:uncharacterized protein LOC133450940 [Cololabis saira]